MRFGIQKIALTLVLQAAGMIQKRRRVPENMSAPLAGIAHSFGKWSK
jgi:hypothetical protein